MLLRQKKKSIKVTSYHASQGNVAIYCHIQKDLKLLLNCVTKLKRVTKRQSF